MPAGQQSSTTHEQVGPETTREQLDSLRTLLEARASDAQAVQPAWLLACAGAGARLPVLPEHAASLRAGPALGEASELATPASAGQAAALGRRASQELSASQEQAGEVLGVLRALRSWLSVLSTRSC